MPPKLCIWQIADSYPPGYGGGSAIYIQDICRSLADIGHEVRVLCVESIDRAPYSVRTEYDGDVRIDRVNLPYFREVDPDGWELNTISWQKHQRRIAKLIEESLAEWRPDIVHYNTSRPFGEECLITIRRQGIPIVGLLHEGWLICPRLVLLRSPTSEPCSGPSTLRCLECLYSYYDRSHLRATLKLPWRILKLGAYPAYRLWRRAAARHSLSAAIGYSHFMVEKHKPHISGPAHYIPLGINLDGLPERRAKRPRNPLRFGFAGGFQPIKGVWDVLTAAAALKRENLAFELHIWGPGQEAGLQEIASRDLVDRVFLHGVYSSEERWRVYEEIDVAIMATTVCEAFGRVTIEAAAVGAPTIAPAVGGIKETIRDGVDGLHYKFRDVQDLERQMRRILTEDELLARLIANLQPVPDTRAQVSEIEKRYFEVLNRIAK